MGLVNESFKVRVVEFLEFNFVYLNFILLTIL